MIQPLEQGPAHAVAPAPAVRGGAWRAVRAPAVVLALTLVPFLVFGEALEAWVRAALSAPSLGAVAQALVVALLASDVLLPVPSSLVSAAAGMAWGPWLGSALSALGMTLGSVLGYALGRWAGRDRIARWASEDEITGVRRLYDRHGEWIVMMLRPVPILAEASAVFAGMSAMPWVRFLGLSLYANVVVSLFYAGAGALVRGLSPAAGFLVLIVMLALAALPWRAARRRTRRARASSG